MSIRGGVRAGAGRPQGGISQTRRLIASAIQQGLAQAGRQKYPGRVDECDNEQAAVDTAAMVVDDMIQAGQGNDVLKLWAAIAMKESGNESNTGKNTLAAALSRLPGAGQVADVSQLGEIPLQPPEQQGGTTHTEREAPPNLPYFAPQTSLGLPDPHAPIREHKRQEPPA